MGFTKYTEKVTDGDTVIVYISYNFIYAVNIVKGQVFQTKYGALKHDDIIGKQYGSKINCAKGYVHILHPTPELWTVTLPHRTQILYNADISMIVLQLDLKPGSKVCEAGTGSGSLSHALCRAVSPGGHLFTFDFHEQRLLQAEKELKTHMHADETGDLFTAQHRDVCSNGFGLSNQVDAVFLDLPSPWSVVPHAIEALSLLGGRLCSFSPCMEQVQKMCQALSEHGFTEISTLECLQTQYEVRNTVFPPLEIPNKDSCDVEKDANSNENEKSAPNEEKRMTVVAAPIKKPGHTGFLTFATLPPRS